MSSGRSPFALLLLLLCARPSAAGAELLYRWFDSEGHLHVTDDLARVPAAERAAAERAAQEAAREPAAWNRLEPQPTVAAPLEPAPRPPEVRRHSIPVARAGLELAVTATLDGRLEAPFKVDTGAALNVLPRRIARQLGLDVSAAAPSTIVAGISGEPRLVPVVTVRELQLGGAVVENVELAVLDTLEYGLLGMPFFNHFRVQIDPERGLLTLEEIDLDQVEGIYGGYDERYWRTHFGLIREQLGRIAAYRRSLPAEYGELHERVQRSADYWQNQYELLDLKATRAGVPSAWRE